jgi:iron(III)-enterobactin esterase
MPAPAGDFVKSTALGPVATYATYRSLLVWSLAPAGLLLLACQGASSGPGAAAGGQVATAETAGISNGGSSSLGGSETSVEAGHEPGGTGGSGDTAGSGNGGTDVGGGAGVAGAGRIVPRCGHAGAAGAPAETSDPGTDGDGVIKIGPSYADALELTPVLGVPQGTRKSFMLSSNASIFPGIAGPFMRTVTVYVPSQYIPGTAAPFIVVQDGSSFVISLPNILNNMINDHRLPVMIAILVDPGPGNDQRSLEYDTVSDAYLNFIENEVLPQAQDRAGVSLTADPEGRAAMGWSSGAAAAFTMAWQCPSLYRRILTYSGTFVNIHPDAQSPHGAWEYHEHLIPESDPKPLRVFLEVGDMDNGNAEPESTMRNWVLANQRMAAALDAKGYHYRFVTAANAGHIDPRVVGQTLPETLAWLWRGYPID